MASKNGKEIYVASIVLLVGTIYLVAQTITLFSGGSTTVKGDSLQISMNKLLSHLRTIFIIVLCFTGGISMLRQKKNRLDHQLCCNPTAVNNCRGYLRKQYSPDQYGRSDYHCRHYYVANSNDFPNPKNYKGEISNRK